MKPAVWTSYFIEQPIREALELFARKGWHYVELSDEHGLQLLAEGAPEKAGRDIASFAADLGVGILQGHLRLPVDIAKDPQEPLIDELKTWLDLFVAIGIEAAVLHPGGDELKKAGAPAPAILERRVKALNALTEHIAGTRTVICLENTPRGACSVEELIEIVDTANSDRLGICLDTGHENMAAREPRAFIRAAGYRLKAMHLDDNDGTGDQHLMPWGQGNVRWDEVAAGLHEIGYRGLLNYEIGGDIRCPLEVRFAKLDFLKTVTELLFGKAETE